MIRIIDKKLCCGCAACVQFCPTKCISLYEDEEGFCYPKADEKICIQCGMCENVCPVINQGCSHQPKRAYAAINPNDNVRAMSSSGGVFSILAEKVIDEHGVVFGARFNEQWEVVHDSSVTKEDIRLFRGSKYVQSRIGDSFIRVKEFLDQGRLVLFSGTPCQVAGLKLLLQKPYENLITIDVACHGVPSPKVWHDYLLSLSDLALIKSISMKDKTDSWRRYKITICGEEGTILSEYALQNKYLLAFSQNLSLRPSCYHCPAKAGKSGSDITLADFWGIEKLLPSMDDNHGTSLVCINTDKGFKLIQALSLRLNGVNYETSVLFNSCIENSVREPHFRSSFWQLYLNSGIRALYSLKPAKASIIYRILHWIIRK